MSDDIDFSDVCDMFYRKSISLTEAELSKDELSDWRRDEFILQGFDDHLNILKRRMLFLLIDHAREEGPKDAGI